jgi:hypothetical protein
MMLAKEVDYSTLTRLMDGGVEGLDQSILVVVHGFKCTSRDGRVNMMRVLQHRNPLVSTYGC